MNLYIMKILITFMLDKCAIILSRDLVKVIKISLGILKYKNDNRAYSGEWYNDKKHGIGFERF